MTSNLLFLFSGRWYIVYQRRFYTHQSHLIQNKIFYINLCMCNLRVRGHGMDWKDFIFAYRTNPEFRMFILLTLSFFGLLFLVVFSIFWVS